MKIDFLHDLEALLNTRKKDRPVGSYTTSLYDSGVQKILQKVGEEAVEYILDAQKAAFSTEPADKERAISEGADLLFHFMVSLVAQGWSLGEIIEELEKRHKK